MPSTFLTRLAGAGALSLALTASSLPLLPAGAAATSAPAPGPAPDAGGWLVEPAGGDSYTVSWRSPTRFPLTSDRPTVGPADPTAADVVVGPPTVSRDGRTVTATVRAATAPVAADLDVVLSGERLDEPGDDRRAAPAGPDGRTSRLAPDPADAVELPVDPGEPGTFETVTSDYELDPVKLPGMPEPIEMVGHVVEPAPGEVEGTTPLVLFQHGRHAVCYKTGTGRPDSQAWPCQAPLSEIPSHLGYDYVQRLLASQGYVTVSVRVNGINAQDYRLPDGGAGARAEIITRHLDHWTGLAEEHQVDLDQVVLVGHSSGGEGVDRASIRIPLSAPYRIAGQVLVAPTDFGSQTAPYVPTVTLLPYCDGDVSDLQGQKFTDVSRDLADDDTSLKSSVLVLGANHNFFNTEWTPGVAAAPANDDWYGPDDAPCGTAHPGRLSGAEQRDVGAAYVAGAVRMFTGPQDVLAMFDGTRVSVPSIGDATVLSHALGGGREVRRPSVDTGLTLAEGARTSFCVGVLKDGVGACGADTARRQVSPHWTASYDPTPTRRFFEMSWDAAGQVGGMLLEEPLDLSQDRLELRTLLDPRSGPVRLAVRLTDADGATAEVVPEDEGVLPALPRALPKAWGQALVVDPAAAAGLDLTRVTAVELVSGTDAGRVWVADVAAAPSSLAPVPQRRAGTIDLGSVRVPEGDGPGREKAEVPFTVRGLDRPGRAVVVMAGSTGRDRFTLDLAPGQTSGSLPFTYEADALDDVYGDRVQLVAYAARGVMTDSYLGDARVVDDDPTPAVTVRPVRRSVPEGRDVRLRVSLAAPVDYSVGVQAAVVRGPRPDVDVADVGRVPGVDRGTAPGDPFGSAGVLLGTFVPAGETSTVVTLPTRVDRRAEPRESVTFRVTVRTGEGKERVTRTVYVVDGSRGR
ncbi:hypothetical protein [Nocardioides sp. AX2bis]|uniref:hypothetical protein n=1 Tax=Nocardioides sp. AX2bis TaxID=2653157 RepID=UPI0012F013D8|nr:hypothetical protein [Nocardioides sp. AX2bis]VXB88070.1 Secreted protein [Nocardioides sp. AX2bis]